MTLKQMSVNPNALTKAEPKMPATTSLSSTLYPIATDAEATRLIWGLARRDRDGGGSMIIPRALTTVEREVVGKRLRHMAPALAPATKADLRKNLDRQHLRSFFLNFGSTRAGSEAEVAAVISEWIVTLSGLPFFAILRSLDRWKRGEVKPEDVGLDKIDRNFAPSATLVRIEGENVARPYWDEARTAKLLLSAKVEPPPMNDEDRAAAVEKIKAIQNRVHADNEAVNARERQEMAAREKARAAERVAADEAMRRREYEAHGLEPVMVTIGSVTYTQSLGLLLKNGWRIEDVDGRPALVSPRHDAA